MISLFSYITIAILGVLVMPKYSSRPYTAPRQTFVVIAGYFLLGVWLFISRQIYINSQVFNLILIMIGWWLLCSALSSRPQIAINEFLKFSFSVCLGLFLVSPEFSLTGLMILVVTAAINATIAILQNVFKFEPFKQIARFKPFYANGLIARTPNALGLYLVPHIFLGAHLARTQSELWSLLVALMLYALWLTKCRASMIALIGAVFFYSVRVSPRFPMAVLILGLLIFLIDKRRRRWMLNRLSSLKDRINYLRIAWLQIKRTPFMGLGFHVMKTRVPYLQRELNEKTNGKFLDPKNYEHPVPQRVHNDYVQTLLDTGAVGLSLLITIIGIAIWKGLSFGNGLAILQVTALIGLLVNGLFFHTFYTLPANVVFWYLIGSLLREPVPWSFDPSIYYWLLYAVIGILIWKHTLRLQAWDFMKYKYASAEIADEKYLKKALELNPNSSTVINWAARYYNVKQEFDKTAMLLTNAIHNYDGQQTLWSLWANLGATYFLAGSTVLSLKASEESLNFLPYFKPAQIHLEIAKKELKKMGLNPEQYLKRRKGNG
jgi:O-antigen ligase